MRVFLAVPADAAWVESASKLTALLRGTLPPAAWTRPGSWHLTLQFLGEISKEAADRFADAIGDRMAFAAEGSLLPGGAILLPGPGRPRVLGAGFSSSSSALPGLSDLACAAEDAAERLGVRATRRAFRPHVTLARVREPWPAEAVESFRRRTDSWAFPPWPVRSCVLYRSQLRPSGALHTPLREWALASPALPVRA